MKIQFLRNSHFKNILPIVFGCWPGSDVGGDGKGGGGGGTKGICGFLLEEATLLVVVVEPRLLLVGKTFRLHNKQNDQFVSHFKKRIYVYACVETCWQQERYASSQGAPNWKALKVQPSDMEPATKPSLHPSQQSW